MKSIKRVKKRMRDEFGDYLFPEINNHNSKKGKPYVRYWQVVKCSKF